jgi:hypothetical protein
MGWYIIPEMFFMENESEEWWLFCIKFIVSFASILQGLLYQTALFLVVAPKYQHPCVYE